MINPVEQISNARRRLRQVAALRAGLRFAVPSLTALSLAAALDPIGAATWERMGYTMPAAALGGLRLGLLAAAVATAAICVWMAWKAYREADDFLDAAERIDAAVGGHQEIVTLASLSDPDRPATERAPRTPLFPLLWRRAAGYLERFDPNRAFAFDARRPLTRSLPIAAAIVAVFAAAAMALVRPPSAERLQALKLRAIAERIATSPNPAKQALASKIFAAAKALENPKLPPEKKLAELDALMRELEKQPPPKAKPAQTDQAKKGNAQGNGNSGTGKKGKGNGQGQGKGRGSGQGNGASETGDKNGPKSDRQIAELTNDVSKAKEQIESGLGGKKNQPPQSGKGNKGTAVKPGNANKKGPSKKPAAIGEPKIPKAQEKASPNHALLSGGDKNGKNQKDGKNGKGDTHLGEIPAPAKFERFYKLGKGPPIVIRNARYVLFRLPTEVTSGAAGKIVPDKERPAASVPYANVPLKAERLDVAPQERQLVPPRYRELIH